MNTDVLDLFLPPVAAWFRQAIGSPTLPQVQGWPAISKSEHTLILAPTGSGKTLAAFLACLDALWRQPDLPRGVRVLYISPLKALNNDIHRNLQRPLEGVQAMAQKMGLPLPILDAAVRTGDTSTSERQRQTRRPPHILITTPESLHLLLTSQARETLRGVTHVIIDEIHALCPNKRGVFLALLLERLEAIQREGSFVRIGLSATQRPLDEVARYLGGAAFDGSCYIPRPVTVVDGGLRKDLDLGIVSPVESFGPLPEQSIWPSIYRLLSTLITSHTSTLVFANDRRSVERITAFLNDEQELARAHHGSVALELRQEIEAALKEGRLPAVVATASLEMGIDMGAVDLVCQVASPGNVARALQRVGRAGHIVGQKSKGRFLPRMAGDLLEQAVLVREMIAGRVEEIRVPTNCLDILAQQVVAMAAMDEWQVPDVYALVRRAYPFRDLTSQVFETTLEMVTGRFRFQPTVPAPGEKPAATLEALQPRIRWDRVHNRLVALPGSKSLALINGGTIPDTGQYAAYTATGVRIGELDEEFIYERRVGDTFLLGTSSWRIDRIETDRVLVSPAEGGAPAIVPFWRGEGGGRSFGLGQAMGVFLRDLLPRLESAEAMAWLQRECGLDPAAARSLRSHVTRQLLAAGVVPTDEHVLIEASRDPLGDWQIILLSPLGQRVHLALRFALENALRSRLGYRPQCLHHDDGLMLRLTDAEEPVLDLFTGITEENLESRILEELADSALFALRFRQNAARALLMPKGAAGRRSPLWLQRLRGRDLLQVARRHPDFPIVVETFRECLHDHLDVPRLREWLARIRTGQITLVTRKAEVPSPFASGLLFAFTAANLYSPDDVEKEANQKSVDRDLLDQLLTPESRQHLLDPRAVTQVDRRLRGVGLPPRTPAEMAEWLRRLGDLTDAELEGPMAGFLAQLAADGQAKRLTLPGPLANPDRWIATEDGDRYEAAFFRDPPDADAARAIFQRYLETHALVGLEDMLTRYPFQRVWAQRQLEDWLRTGRAVQVQGDRFATPENLEQVQRGSLGLLRREVVACQPAAFADFVTRWQRLHPAGQRGGPEGLAETLGRLQGLALPMELWEQTVLPARVPGYQPRWLDDWVAGGNGVWVARGEAVAFFHRSMLAQSEPITSAPLDEPLRIVAECLANHGASFLSDLALALQKPPSEVRKHLWELVRRGRVSCDRVEVARQGEPDEEPPPTTSRSRLRSLRRLAVQRPEGRWEWLKWGNPPPEELAVAQCSLLLERYGIAARELAALDDALLPWRVLYEVLSRLELTGEVRRGYFVEGLSGAQFALPEAMDLLQEADTPSTAAAKVLLMQSMDPANLYGAGAPFDVPLLDGGTRPLLRRPGNWLVVKAGRPVLLIEGQGKKLTALASASREDLLAATQTIPNMFISGSNLTVRHKLCVEEWNGQPVTTTVGREYLEAAGFVRDYQGMTLYAAWR
jgi:ATP-dependent Lhr-like helicase